MHMQTLVAWKLDSVLLGTYPDGGQKFIIIHIAVSVLVERVENSFQFLFRHPGNYSLASFHELIKCQLAVTGSIHQSEFPANQVPQILQAQNL